MAWKLSQSSHVDRLFVAPGNGGTARLPHTQNVPIAANALAELRDFASRHAIDLTVVGPEAPLVEGFVDLFHAAGLRVFGPSRTAAQLEGSKAFSKRFMEKYGIPTARAGIFTDFDEATRYLRGLDDVPVIKASGLAAGKGVILPDTMVEAAQVLQSILLQRRFGAAGETVVVEERLTGPEVSVLAFCDGKRARIMPPTQDHKRLLDGDHGPNTGGMGAFAPAPLASPHMLARVEEEVLQPTLDGIAAEGAPYVGVLYAGLMITDDGPKVLEFNCRFGDPESQVLLPLLQSDLVEVIVACLDGDLDQAALRWHPQAAVTVVLASGGYPNEYTAGVEITGIEAAEARGCTVFHAGTKIKDGRLLTDGGRVLAVTALGDSVKGAASHAYGGVAAIRFNQVHYRTDIGRRARQR